MSQFGAPARVQANGKVAYLADADVEQAQYHLLFPNFTLNIDPGPGNMSVDVTRPAGPGRCAGSTEYFFYEEVSDETAEEMMAFANQVGPEDASLVASVQVGLTSGMIPHGRLLPSSDSTSLDLQALPAARARGAQRNHTTCRPLTRATRSSSSRSRSARRRSGTASTRCRTARASACRSPAGRRATGR